MAMVVETENKNSVTTKYMDEPPNSFLFLLLLFHIIKVSFYHD